MSNPSIPSPGDEPTWPPETIESILRHSMPPLADGPMDAAAAQAMREEAFELGLFNERAAVLMVLDYLARDFLAAGDKEGEQRVRQAMGKIDGRLR